MKEGHILQCGTPSEIYNHPNCRFVAEFIGTANIFDVERQGNILESKFGQFVPKTMPEWKKGSLVIRPEGIRLRRKNRPRTAFGPVSLKNTTGVPIRTSPLKPATCA
jgi:ABC-type spermidine/putrescine transport systems, ATPase components